jgi:hypothetical protein
MVAQKEQPDESDHMPGPLIFSKSPMVEIDDNVLRAQEQGVTTEQPFFNQTRALVCRPLSQLFIQC